MTLGGETDSSNPSRLIFSIKIPVKHKHLKSEPRSTDITLHAIRNLRHENETDVIVNLSTVNFLCLI